MISNACPSCLILGATGFIGGNIARFAFENGCQVRGFRRKPDSTGHIGDIPIDWHEGDLGDLDSLVAAMQGVDVVFHAAAFYPTRSIPREVPVQVDHAIQEMDRVIKAARIAKVDRFIYTSSLTTIGHPPGTQDHLADENDFYIPGTLKKSAYYEAKIAMERVVLDATRDGFPAVVMNPTAVFGPGDVHLTLGRILLAVKRGWGIAWLPVTTNVIDVRDVAFCHLAAARKGRIGDRYILGAHNMAIKDILEIASHILNVHPPRFEVSIQTIQRLVDLIDLLPFLSTGNHMRAIPFWQGYNTEKVRTELSLTPRPFEQTIQDAMTWFKENGLWD
jgi:dihydroflavonol-4-reductase